MCYCEFNYTSDGSLYEYPSDLHPTVFCAEFKTKKESTGEAVIELLEFAEDKGSLLIAFEKRNLIFDAQIIQHGGPAIDYVEFVSYSALPDNLKLKAIKENGSERVNNYVYNFDSGELRESKNLILLDRDQLHSLVKTGACLIEKN